MITIYDIKELTKETAPYFFSRDSMMFFGQTMRSFRLKKQPDGRIKISAPMIDRSNNRQMGETVRFFNPANNKLEFE